MENNINNNQNLDFFEENKRFNLIQEFFKYFAFWKIFLTSIIFSIVIISIFHRYSNNEYLTNAKIKILDKKESAIELPSFEDLFSSSKINIENEIEVLKSYSILKQVIKNKNLIYTILEIGTIKSMMVLDYPFFLEAIIVEENMEESQYVLTLTENGLVVSNKIDKQSLIFKSFTTIGSKHNLPFEISNVNLDLWEKNKEYAVQTHSLKKLILNFKEEIKALKVGKDSEIINLEFKHSNRDYAKIVLNELIDVFNNDGIKDRQLIHERTINFVNDRYAFLSVELDSIEIDKENFKYNNDLVDLQVNSVISLEKSAKFDESVFNNENQIYIVQSLLNMLKSKNDDLLPSNIGVENKELNSLIYQYNEFILDKNKLIQSAGKSNPTIKQIEKVITDLRYNIMFSLESYYDQLKVIKQELLNQYNRFDSQVSEIPKKEKILRSIERNQEIKEALYLFLLQKREEAQVSYAITEPSIKVVEYAFSFDTPSYPLKKINYLLAILFSILLPFTFLYIFFLYDTKVRSRFDIESYENNLNIIGEIPFFDVSDTEKLFINPNDRSVVSESFRMLMSNLRYLQDIDSKTNVLLVTSSLKGEGKTLNTLNLGLSFSSVGKKVLLIGADLRNPQLHRYFGYDKNTPGLVDFLVDSSIDWRKNIICPFENHQNLDIILSGPIPPNPLNLINNGNIDILIEDAKKEYDYIIFDSAPTLLVADTKSLINRSDILIYLVRCNVTDKEILKHINDISIDTKKNVGIILNGVGQKNSYGYSYGYRYGYGYSYKYSYNYGYGYGYSSDNE